MSFKDNDLFLFILFHTPKHNYFKPNIFTDTIFLSAFRVLLFDKVTCFFKSSIKRFHYSFEYLAALKVLAFLIPLKIYKFIQLPNSSSPKLRLSRAECGQHCGWTPLCLCRVPSHPQDSPLHSRMCGHWFLCLFFPMLRLEPKALHQADKHSVL